MPEFRTHTPTRRGNPKVVTRYQEYKEDLKIDFVSRCGYCNSSDGWKLTYYEVDHFIPLHILTIKSDTDYTNLVYSCRSCNNAKRKKWPTNDQNTPNLNDQGFLDPCDDNYARHFTRKDNGEIFYTSQLGRWMYDALNLHKPQHAIIWNLEQLEPVIAGIRELVDDPKIAADMQTRILAVYAQYTDYINQWRGL
jgi:hypothetical protein